MKENPPQPVNNPKPLVLRETGDLRGKRRFSLISAFLVIAILALLAAIAIPNFISYRQRGYCSEPSASAHDAYTAAQGYFADWPEGAVNLVILARYGFVQSSNVTVAVRSGTKETLTLTARYMRGPPPFRTSTVDPAGRIIRGRR